jgi:hypothetical protein
MENSKIKIKGAYGILFRRNCNSNMHVNALEIHSLTNIRKQIITITKEQYVNILSKNAQ